MTDSVSQAPSAGGFLVEEGFKRDLEMAAWLAVRPIPLEEAAFWFAFYLDLRGRFA